MPIVWQIPGRGAILLAINKRRCFAPHMGRRIFHITNLIFHSLRRSWSVSGMADEIKMSAPHFQKRFKQVTGSTPIAYLNDLRLEKARELLNDDSCFLQIKEIGNQVGLVNDSHFTRDFKKKFGVTPNEYRKQHWKHEHLISPDGQEW